MHNADVFYRSPLTFKIPNSGVTTLSVPKTGEEWDTLRWELQSFVCEGQYAAGMKRLLESYLRDLGQADQPGWWVSGFYGSGKSHFVRVLQHLWADTTFPDGTRARELVQLPEELAHLLLELTTTARREGGLWSASGTLGASAEGGVRLGFASILFRAAHLPESYQQARLELWLRERNLLEAVRARVEALGETWESALNNMFVSPALARAVLEGSPNFRDEGDVRQSLRTQFPKPSDLTEAELLQVTEDVLRLVSTREGRLPCTLVVIDEVQQFIGDSTTRVDQVARLAESMTKRFGGRLLLVGTGQSAMNAMPQLAKIKDRFPMSIELSSTDVEQVVRRVILYKDPQHLPRLEATLDAASGEIARHLGGTPLAYRDADHADLARDYPILPTRRRLWSRFLQTIDSGGSSTQLRSQLRIMLDASREVATRPLGHVIGAEFVYRPVAGYMRSAGSLLDDTYTLIEGLGDTEGSPLPQRIAQLLFILSRLDPKLGIRPTESTLADLLVEDLQAGSGGLRSELPDVLRAMVEDGHVMKDRDEYRLQTREGADWNGAFTERYRDLISDAVRQTNERTALTKTAVEAAARSHLTTAQGTSKTSRKAELTYDPPAPGGGTLPIWVRFGWNDSLDTVRQDALQAGHDSATVFVYLPEPSAGKLRDLIAGKLAADDVLTARPNPGTEEARQARAAMLSRRDLARSELENLITRSVEGARVFQGGGQELEGGLRHALKPALDASVARLYHKFAEGDHARWEPTRRKAQQGDQTALENVGHLGAPTEHPVLKAVLGFIGAGKKGSDFRKYFTGVPYGWPQDAVDTALVLLTLTGHLRATLNGSPLEARQLDAQTLPKADFRPETVTLTATQRMEVRKLYQKMGLSAESGKEAAQASSYVGRLQDLVNRSGGEAPLPEHLPHGALKALSGLSGTELLLQLALSAPELEALRVAAEARKELISTRLDHWNKLSRLLKHNKNPELQRQADAIRDHRLLLNDPDPLEPLRNEVMNGLRADLLAARDAYTQAYQAGMDSLDALSEWAALPSPERQAWLRKENLAPLEKANLDGINEVVNALEARGLSEWEAQTKALPRRFDEMRMAFQKSLEPEAVLLRPRGATLKTVADVDEYLNVLKAELLRAVQEGRPVIVQG